MVSYPYKLFPRLVVIVTIVVAWLPNAGLKGASTPSSTLSTSFPNAAFQLAVKYVTVNPISDSKTTDDLLMEDAFKNFASSQGLKPGGKMAQAVATLVLPLRTAAKTAVDEGIEADLTKPAFKLVLQEAATDALGVPVDTLGGSSAITYFTPSSSAAAPAPEARNIAEAKPSASKNPATPNPQKPAAAPSSEPAKIVDDSDKDEYERLLDEAQELRVDIPIYQNLTQSKSSDTANNVDGKTKAELAQVKLDEVKHRLSLNLARQKVLTTSYAKSNTNTAKTNLKPGEDATAAQAALDQATAESDQALASYNALSADLEKQRAALPEDQVEYAGLTSQELKLTQDRDADNTTISAIKETISNSEKTIYDQTSSLDKVNSAKTAEADAKSKLTAAQADLSDTEKKLKANSAQLDLLRAKYDRESLAAENLAFGNKISQIKIDQANSKVETMQAGSDALKNQLLDTNADFAKIQAYFHLGVVLLNPYTISKKPEANPTELVINPASGTDTNAFFEFVYTNRWAWNAQRVNNEFPNPATQEDHHKAWEQIDVQGRLGYTFTSGSTPTANTLVGSGNINAEISVGWPVLLYRSKGDSSQFSFGPVVSDALVTDRSAFRAHNRLLAGLDYTTSFSDPLGSTDNQKDPRRVLLDIRSGWALIDRVQYQPDPITGQAPNSDSQIKSDANLLPRYSYKDVGAAGAELLYPFNSSSYITFNAQIYNKVHPGQWSVQIGTTTSLDSLIKSFSN